jgi:hypothetical protein
MGRASGKGTQAASAHTRSRNTVAVSEVERRLPELRFDQSIRTLGEVTRWLSETEEFPIELNPAYQRAEVWDEERKTNLIKSVLMGLPIGGIYINNRKADYSEPRRCIDGQQRLRALSEFINGDFAIPTAWVDDRALGDYRVVPEDYTAETIRYTDFGVPGQRFFCFNTLAVYETNLKSEREEAELFLLINFGGVPQSDEDWARAESVARSA